MSWGLLCGCRQYATKAVEYEGGSTVEYFCEGCVSQVYLRPTGRSRLTVRELTDQEKKALG